MLIGPAIIVERVSHVAKGVSFLFPRRHHAGKQAFWGGVGHLYYYLDSFVVATHKGNLLNELT